jgi:leucyl-tRNA synthetase
VVLQDHRLRERLLDDLDTIDWPEHVKTMQRNWIGRSEGAEVTSTAGARDRLPGLHDAPRHAVRRDVLRHGARAPRRRAARRRHEHEQAVHDYVNHALTASNEPSAGRRQAEDRRAARAHVINPVNGEQIPMFVADYVLMEYGTGAIMAVPAHDERDFDFAQALRPPIRRVIEGGRAARTRATGRSSTRVISMASN